jgi:hypothetical protein
MIGWLSSKIMQWAREYNDGDGELVAGPGRSRKRHRNDAITVDSQNGPDIPRTFRFEVSVGRGGIVLVTRRYDPKKDENIEILHVIHDNDDIAHSVGQIVAMEIIK